MHRQALHHTIHSAAQEREIAKQTQFNVYKPNDRVKCVTQKW